MIGVNIDDDDGVMTISGADSLFVVDSADDDIIERFYSTVSYTNFIRCVELSAILNYHC